jgi:hypothetical protein
MITGKCKFILLLSMPFLFFVSCATMPTELQTKAHVESFLNNNWPGMCRIVSFNKTNGEGDSKHYTIYYEYSGEILQDTDGRRKGKLGYNISEINNIKWVKRQIPAKPLYYNELPSLKKGDTFRCTGSISFTKTEKGWIRN